jgi:hypothetical protein
VDDSHQVIDINVPAGIDERDVEVFSSALDINGQLDVRRSTRVLKTKQRSRKRG